MKKTIILSVLFFCLFSFTSTGLLAQVPAQNASNNQVSYKWPTSVSLTWTRGSGQNCFVVMRKNTSSGIVPPSSMGSGVIYASGNYGSGYSFGNGDNFVVYQGSGNSVYVYNLTPNTVYDAYVYEYNTLFSTFYINQNWQQSAATFCTLSTQPTSCGSIYTSTSITDTTGILYFTAGSSSGRLITLAPTSVSPSSPTNGNYYAPNSNYGSGAYLGGAYSVYDGSGTGVSVSGLQGATNYTARDYEFDNGTYPTYAGYNYNTRCYYSCGSYTFNTTNMPPTINPVNSFTICQDAGYQYVGLYGVTSGSPHENQSLTLTCTSSNPTLISNQTVYSGNYLYMQTNPGQSGTSVMTVTVDDGWFVNNTTSITFTLTVLPIPGSAGAISGNSPICAGLNNQTYSISPTASTTTYSWTLPSGFNIVSGAGTNVITVSTATNSASGALTVIPTNLSGCGDGASSSINIQVDAQPETAEAGPDQPLVCGGAAVLNATAVSSPDMGQWAWLSGTPVPSIGTNTVNSTSISGLTSPNTYVYVWTVTRTGSSCPAKTDTVNITTNWASITCQPAAAFSFGPSSDVANNMVCVNSTVNFTDLSVSANQWQWDFTYNGSIPNFTSTSQNPVHTYTAVGTYTVYLKIYSNATSQYYTTSSVVTVIGPPSAPGTIFGTTGGICAGSANQYVYSISNVTNATGYNWTVPSGAVISAYPSPTSIAATFGHNAMSGMVKVSASNSCGTSTVSTLAITVNPLPHSSGQSIVGPTVVCQGQNNLSYSISPINNSTSYTWTGLSGVQTNTQNTYSMNIGVNATTGTISVMGSNACGTGDTITLNITVHPLPGPAGVVHGNSSVHLCPSPGALSYSTALIANVTTYNWTLPTGVSITSGTNTNSIQVNFSNATPGGSHYIVVSGSNGCGTGPADSINVFINSPSVPQICMVTVDDSSTHNIIYWDKTNVTGADSFRIYREDVTNVYHRIGTVGKNSLSEFHDYDPVANPNTTTKRYKLSAIDSCGIESALSNYHNTIYIVDNGLGQFSWNQLYSIQNSANPVNNYVLMCDTNNTGFWKQIASTAGTQQNINDVNFAAHQALANWRVETVWGITCTPSARGSSNMNGQSTVVRSKSNITNNRQVGIRKFTAGNFSLYPNPTNGHVSLTFDALTQGKTTVKVTSLLVQELYSEVLPAQTSNYTIDLGKYQPGTYMVQVVSNNGTVIRKVIKN